MSYLSREQLSPLKAAWLCHRDAENPVTVPESGAPNDLRFDLALTNLLPSRRSY
jgi:hypothetical protein